MIKLKFSLIFCILISVIFQIYGKDTLDVVVYATSQDLYQEKPINVNAIVISDEVGNNYFYANKILDTSSNKKVKDSKFIFAIKY